jgi:predicted ATPase
MEAFVCSCLGIRQLPPTAAELIYRRAEGHPLFSRELGTLLLPHLAMHQNGHTAVHDLPALPLPETIQKLLTNQLDRLGHTHQLALKTASVIGRRFDAATLAAIYPLPQEKAHLATCLRELEGMEFIYRPPAERRAEATGTAVVYHFTYSLMQEVAYNLLSFQQREQLRQAIAHWRAAEG